MQRTSGRFPLLSVVLVAALVGVSGRASALAADQDPVADPTAGPSPSPLPSGQPPFGASVTLGEVDRALIDSAITALMQGDLDHAKIVLARAVDAATTLEGRAAAAVLLGRVDALIVRRRAELASAASGIGNKRSDPASARPTFVLSTTLLGLAAWGWTMPLALGVKPSESPRAMVGLYMVTAASAFVAPLLLTRDTHVDWGEMNLAFYGGTRGLEYGLLVSNLLLGARGGSPTDNDPQAFSASLLVGSVGGLLAGYAWASATAVDAGRAHTIAVMGDYGLLTGLVTSHLLGVDDLKDKNGVPRQDAQARSVSAFGLVGSSLGLAGGWWLGGARDNSWGDGEVMRAAGLFGVLSGATVSFLGGFADESRALTAALAVGGGLGLVLGDRLVRETDFSVGQSVLVDLALLAGGLGGAGLTYLIARTDSPKAYFGAATLGALAGGGAAYAAQRGERPRTRTMATPAIAIAPRFGSGEAGLSLLGAF